jgi:nucleotide-binding universal stress UspA family protein
LGQSDENLLKTATYLAITFNSEVSLVHVMPDLSETPMIKDLVQESATRELLKKEEALKAEKVSLGKSILKSGTPFLNIIDQADQEDANLIIVGEGGKGQGTLGITAEKVIRKAIKPVWLVKSDNQLPVNRIICAVDFSSPSRRAVKNAVHLARRFAAELTILHVIETAGGFYQKLIKPSAEEREKRLQLHNKKFDDFLKDIDFVDVTWHKQVTEGKPDEEILALVRKLKCDLLIMGAVGASNNARILIGQTAERVVRESPCSVVTLKSESAIQIHLDSEIADLSAHFQQGKDLLEEGFAEEAIQQFKICIDKDMLYAPAWEALAVAHDRLGRKEQAEQFIQKAKDIRQNLWEQQVNADIRKGHSLWQKKK